METLKQEDLQIIYRFMLMPSTSPMLTIRAVNQPPAFSTHTPPVPAV